MRDLSNAAVKGLTDSGSPSSISNIPTKSKEPVEVVSKLSPDSSEPDTLKILENGLDNNASKISSESKNSGTISNNKPSEREGNCYCGKERNLNIVELLCANCNRWFHESCIGYQLGKLVPFMMNYIFVCKNCSPTGLESFKKTQALFPQMCVTALGNLMQQTIKEGASQTEFSKDKHIIPFIDCHWDSMTTTPRRVTQSWHSTVLRALIKETNIIFACNESAPNGPLYSLMAPDVTQIKPNYEAMIKGGHLKVTEMGIQHGGGTGLKGRNAKRKVPGEGGTGAGKKGRGAGDLSAPKLPAHGYPLEHPYNKDGYRYILAEPDPNAPFRQEFDESSDWAGKPIPGWLYRTLSPASVLLALHDRAPQLRISEDRLTVTGDKGYCMVRATHAVSRGCWYYEAVIEEMPDGSAARLGWAQEYANLQAPLGYDKFGYSWRSRKGTRFHECRGKHFSRGFGEGDTLGCLIVLPTDNSRSHIPQTYKDRPLVKFKSHLYYEEKDRVTECLKNLKPLPGSKIIFFINGEYQGEAFVDIYAGAYYPTISIHKSATVSVNFGPNFKNLPSTSEYNYRGMWEKAEEAICEQTMADLLYLTENDGKLRLDALP
ncbi:set1/Ash2 histone methyltransferase complex subunit ASH2 isoform X2 [Nilaparvata lugens]|nr:set1/Ash2 histone methyltransferase complex subunit ASH2 isoform X2 [Nilaparvata lugens]XP_039297628.1 set1/Ash2 histone methyltransferase complex subunit ASH2 isoform X2 [Nilaparvata lugens]XP_039297629.1 set1/Ash2 histone methyltransferase complex subunit ASH2 isoform X2 [Nilaparvata lugens]